MCFLSTCLSRKVFVWKIQILDVLAEMILMKTILIQVKKINRIGMVLCPHTHLFFFPFLFFFLPPQGGECLKPTGSKKAGEHNHPGYSRVNAPDCAMNCFVPSTREKEMGMVISLSNFWYGLAQLLFKQTCRQLERKWPCIFLILPQATYLLNLFKVIVPFSY